LSSLKKSKHTDVIQCSIDAHNNPLTDEALAAAKGADAIILGAVGGPVRIVHRMKRNAC
jgi:isocitrate/isopropylmalate dehydrogenase